MHQGVLRERHCPRSRFIANRFQRAQSLRPLVLSPFRKIHSASGLRYIPCNHPGSGGNVTVPWPARLVGVTIKTRVPEDGINIGGNGDVCRDRKCVLNRRVSSVRLNNLCTEEQNSNDGGSVNDFTFHALVLLSDNWELAKRTTAISGWEASRVSI